MVAHLCWVIFLSNFVLILSTDFYLQTIIILFLAKILYQVNKFVLENDFIQICAKQIAF